MSDNNKNKVLFKVLRSVLTVLFAAVVTAVVFFTIKIIG